MSGYVYGEFLERVRAHQHARGRTGPTGCWVCDELLPVVSRAEKLRQAVTEEAFVAQARARCEVVSGGIVDAHHCLPKRVIKAELAPRELHESLTAARLRIDGALMDPRNGILLRRYHHDLLESRSIAIPKGLWPDDALAFARELGLEWWIDNMESRRA